MCISVCIIDLPKQMHMYISYYVLVCVYQVCGCVYTSMCTLVDVVCGGINTVCECSVRMGYTPCTYVYTYHTYVCTCVCTLHAYVRM